MEKREVAMRIGLNIVLGLSVSVLAGCGPAAVDAPIEAGGGAAFSDGPTAMPNGQQYTAVIAEGATPDSMRAASAAFCADKEWCQVMAWPDNSNRPGAMPMLDREHEAMQFTYLLNRATSYEQVLWDCNRWPGEAKDCSNVEESAEE